MVSSVPAFSKSPTVSRFTSNFQIIIFHPFLCPSLTLLIVLRFCSLPWVFKISVRELEYNVIIFHVIIWNGNWCWSWNSNTLATWCKELTYWRRPRCWGRLKAGGEGDDRGWDGWMASPTRWTWVWASSESWWWTGSLVCSSPWGRKVLDTTESTELNVNWVPLKEVMSLALNTMYIQRKTLRKAFREKNNFSKL